MNTHSPTEQEIAQRARQLWKDRGSPTGQDTAIWLEAERQLAKPVAAANAPSATAGRGNGNTQASKTPADPKAADLKPTSKGKGKGAAAASSAAAAAKSSGQTERLRGEMASESEVEFQITPAVPDDEAIKAALQKREARAPQKPAKNAPHAKPVESGKPLWDKPHSS